MNWWLTISAIGDGWCWKQTATLDDGSDVEVGNDVGSTVTWTRWWRRRMTTLDVELVRHERSGSSWLWRLSCKSQIVRKSGERLLDISTHHVGSWRFFHVRCLRRYDEMLSRRLRRIQPAEVKSFIVEVVFWNRGSPPVSRWKFLFNRLFHGVRLL